MYKQKTYVKFPESDICTAFTWDDALVVKRHMLNYGGLKCYICNLFSSASGGEITYIK